MTYQESIEKIFQISKENGFSDPTEYILHLQKKIDNFEDSNKSKQYVDIQYENRLEVAFETNLGKIYHGDSSYFMSDILEENSIDLIITSPPFALVRKKDYGNEDADRYLAWFRKFARGFRKVLKDSGSLVIDIGGAWKKGRPVCRQNNLDK